MLGQLQEMRVLFLSHSCSLASKNEVVGKKNLAVASSWVVIL